jgi:hypothetical protein
MGGGKMRKKHFFLIALIIVSVISLRSHGWCQVIKNVKANMTKQQDGFIVTATWDVNYQHWKYDFNTITQKGGIWMDCITSFDSQGLTYKAVVGSAMLGSLTKGSGLGTLSCHIPNGKISKNGYHIWVRLKVRIAGNWEEPIWAYAGRIK